MLDIFSITVFSLIKRLTVCFAGVLRELQGAVAGMQEASMIVFPA